MFGICAWLDVDGVAGRAELLQTVGGDDDTILAQEGHNGSFGRKYDVLDLEQVSAQMRQLSTSNCSQS